MLRRTMLLEHYQAMARYNAWMNDKLLAVAAELTDAERKRNLGAFFGSIHNTFNHLLLADRIWLGRFTKDAETFASRDAAGDVIPLRSLDQVLYEDFEQFTRERRRTDEQITAWIGGLDAGALSEEFSYSTMRGDPSRHPLWWALSHFFNHQTHHRGQLTTLLVQCGRDPGVTDLLVLLRQW